MKECMILDIQKKGLVNQSHGLWVVANASRLLVWPEGQRQLQEQPLTTLYTFVCFKNYGSL